MSKRADIQDAVLYVLREVKKETATPSDEYLATYITAAVVKVLVWDAMERLTMAERQAFADELTTP